MIVVLADDLSGAAELAGVALQHGLSAEVQTAFHAAANTDVVCLDTNTRLCAEAEASARVSAIGREVRAARPAWIFKKCDSVLRGPVLAEARAVARAAGKSRIVILSANPSRNRIIRAGRYFVDGRPLSETAFARDPIHPRHTSKLADLVGGDLAGVSLPDAESAADMQRQAHDLDDSTLPVGAADFFKALLEVKEPRKPAPLPPVIDPAPTLLVCGSAAAWNQRRHEAGARGLPVFALPHDPAAIASGVSSSGFAVLGIGDGPATRGQSPEALTAGLARTVGRVLQIIAVARVMLEGGATAAALLGSLGPSRLEALGTIGDVALLRPVNAASPLMCIKPGSYPWPEALWPQK